MSKISDCVCLESMVFPPPAPLPPLDAIADAVDDGKDDRVGGGTHSTAATIHPFEAATHLGRGGRTGLVEEIERSSSSMSSGFIAGYVMEYCEQKFWGVVECICCFEPVWIELYVYCSAFAIAIRIKQ